MCQIDNASASLHWRHNEHGGVSNHQPHGCLLNRLFRHRSKKTSKLRVTSLCVGNSPGPVNSPHKGPVTRKMFPFDDVVMIGSGRKGRKGQVIASAKVDPDLCRHMAPLHDDIIKWKHFPRYWPFVRRIQRSPVNFPHKGQSRGDLMFFFYQRLNKRLSKQSWGWWLETLSHLLWRHRNEETICQNGATWYIPEPMLCPCFTVI